MDEEESYFDCDDGEDEKQPMNATDNESDLHRTPRMFSLSEQAASLESHGTGTTHEESEAGSRETVATGVAESGRSADYAIK